MTTDTSDNRSPMRGDADEPNVIVLDARQSRLFCEAILDEKEPSETLKQAARRYRERMGV